MPSPPVQAPSTEPWTQLYGVLAGELSLDAALRRAIAAPGADFGFLIADSGGEHRLLALAAPPDIARAYRSDSTRNPWITRRPRHYDQFVRTTEYETTDSWVQSEYFRDCLKTCGMEMTFGLSASVRLDDRELIVLLGRPRERGMFSDGEIASAGRLLPHLARVVRVQVQIERAAAATAFQDSAIDALALAILRVDETGTVLYRNRMADELFRRSDGMHIRGDQLTAAATRRLVGDSPDARGGLARNRLFPLQLEDGRPPAIAISTPLISNGARQFMIAISDAGLQSAALRGHLVGAFKLSPAELELAMALFQGRTLAEIAANRGLSINTLRVQLRGVLKKTGVNRQTGLVALIGRIPPVRPPLSV